MADPANIGHEQAEALLPWYATGQLEGNERALVEKHLASCVACQRQLRFDHRLVEEFPALDPQFDGNWARLRGRIDREARSPRRIVPWTGAWDLLKRRAVAALAAAQLAFVVIAGAVLLSLSRPQYQALGSAGPPAAANVVVMFRTTATHSQVLETLRASGASVVGGPTSAGAFLVHVPQDRRPAVVAMLQVDPQVELAQPVDGVAQ
jgi:anti-sigma factor RsiW